MKYLTEFNWFTVDTSHISTTYGVTDTNEIAMFGKCGITDYVLCEDYLCARLSNDTRVIMESSNAAQIAKDGSISESDLHDLHTPVPEPITPDGNTRRRLDETSPPVSRALQATTPVPDPQTKYSKFFSDSKTTVKDAATY